MPHRRVHFDMPARVARQPRDDERSVMRYFMRHVRCCMCCWTSVDSQGSTQLCSRGSEYARDVLQYMYFKRGKAFALLDWQRGYGDVQIEVPPQYAPLIMLFSQSASLFHDRPPSNRPSTRTYQIRKSPKTHIHERNGADGRKAKDSRSKDQVHEHFGDYITVCAAIPAMTIPLRVKRADLVEGTSKNII